MRSCADGYLGLNVVYVLIPPAVQDYSQLPRQARTCIPLTLSSAVRENHNHDTIQVHSQTWVRQGYVAELYKVFDETDKLVVQRRTNTTTRQTDPP
jgi:uncharacterized lipoprotein YddW (UPF0748 family)